MVNLGRRNFLKVTLGSAVAGGFLGFHPIAMAGKLFDLGESPARVDESKLLHRFVAMGDPHYGEPSKSSSDQVGVDDRTGPPVEPIGYEETARDMVEALLAEKNGRGLDFFIINGDVQRREEEFRDRYLARVGVPYYVTNGNHDLWPEQRSQELWGHSLNHRVSIGDYGLIFLDSSGTIGATARRYIGGEDFLAESLREYRSQRGVIFVSHIPRFSGFRKNQRLDAPQRDGIINLLKESNNFICGIHSHFHEEVRIFQHQGMPFCFTGRYGGSYGINFYGYRVFEIYDNGVVLTQLYNDTMKRIAVLDNVSAHF